MCEYQWTIKRLEAIDKIELFSLVVIPLFSNLKEEEEEKGSGKYLHNYKLTIPFKNFSSPSTVTRGSTFMLRPL